MADDLQHGINEAALYFYKEYEHEQQITDKTKLDREKNVLLQDMNPLLMIGVGYLVAKGCLRYRGGQYYAVNEEGFRYYKSLIENGDIEL